MTKNDILNDINIITAHPFYSDKGEIHIKLGSDDTEISRWRKLG